MKHTRTRTGCHMCKQRRIKCDETKPRCQRCTRQSLECRYPGLPIHTAPSIPSTLSLNQSASSDPRIKYAFQEYVRFSSRDMVSCSWPIHLPTTASPLPFLFSLRSAEPALDYLFAALCTVQRSAWQLPPPTRADDQAYASFYHAALAQGVQALVARGAEMPPEALVVGHEMLVTAEVVRSGELGAALKMLEAFREVLSGWKRNSNKDKMDLAITAAPWYESICDVFRETTRLLEGQVNQIPSHPGAFLLDDSSHSSTITGCADDLEALVFSWLVPLLRWNTSSWVRRLDLTVMLPLLERWWQQFQRLESDLPRSTDDELRFYGIQLQFSTISGIVEYRSASSNGIRSSAAWQKVLDLYRQIETLHETVWTDKAHLFAPFGLVAPAFALGVCCGSRELRQQAREILLKSDFHDRNWNSKLAHLISSPIDTVLHALEEEQDRANDLSLLDLPVVYPDRATYQFIDESSSEVTLHYHLKFRNKRAQFYSKALKVVRPDFIEACENASWPLDEIVKSLGYHHSGTIVSPYMATRSAIEKRVEVKKHLR